MTQLGSLPRNENAENFLTWNASMLILESDETPQGAKLGLGQIGNGAVA